MTWPLVERLELHAQFDAVGVVLAPPSAGVGVGREQPVHRGSRSVVKPKPPVLSGVAAAGPWPDTVAV